jgi:hypothetical protein
MSHPRVSFVLLVLFTALSAGSAFAQWPALPVKVVNTPLPVLVSNPVSSVAVTSLPPVVISGMPTVAVSGTVWVKADDNPDGQEIFQDSLTMLQFDPLEGSSECMPELPEGTRLIIEHVSARVKLPADQQGYVALKTHSLHIASMLPLTPQMTENGYTTYAAAVSLRLRVEPPHRPCFLFERNEGAGQGTALFTISGYLISAER